MILFGLLCAFTVRAASGIPVFPCPQHTVVGTRKLDLGGRMLVNGTSLDLAMADRLAAVTGFVPDGKGLKLRLIDADTLAAVAREWHKQIGEEGYVLKLEAGEHLLVANTETGLFYGLQTYRQLLDADWDKEVFIADWPSFSQRIIFDDISRGPISTVDFVKRQIERLASLKVNGLSFYIEHVIQPSSYPDFAPKDGKFTMDQIRELSAYAAKYHIQLVGSFQSFGHFNNILSLPRYRSMGETSTMISPLDPKARHFLKSVISEMCEVFQAPYFNVNCDETFDLGKGKSKSYTDSVGVAKFYADHIRFLYDVVKAKGKQLMMWGDIALQHEEILDMLPEDIMYLTWEYGDPSSYDRWIDPFAKRELPFMVCPGILNSNRLFPDLAIAKANINGFVDAGYENGAKGVYTTIWDEGGRDQLFSMDWYGVSLAAEKSWNARAPLDEDADKRFELTAYGVRNGGVVEAIGQLMELRDLPLTYNMTDQVWWQQILPKGGETVILNNTDVVQALEWVEGARYHLSTVEAIRHQGDIATLRYIADRYKLLLDSRTELAAMAEKYRMQGNGNEPLVNDCFDRISRLKDRYAELERNFCSLWENENQPYSLDYARKPYEDRIAALAHLERNLARTLGNLVVTDRYYFSYWLLAGPFASTASDFPGFLYSENEAEDRPPKPGDFASYGGKSFRWMKYNSDKGGIVRQPGADTGFVYAYARLNTEKDLNLTAFVGNDTNVKLFCNDKEVAPDETHYPIKDAVLPKERSYELPLVKGMNYIVLKVRKEQAKGQFTFRLDTSLPITNHKYTYTLNPNPERHEAD